jgi:hypothetical protein
MLRDIPVPGYPVKSRDQKIPGSKNPGIKKSLGLRNPGILKTEKSRD